MKATILAAGALCLACASANAGDSGEQSRVQKMFLLDQYFLLAQRQCGIPGDAPTARDGEWAARSITEEEGNRLIERVVAAFDANVKKKGLPAVCQQVREDMAEFARTEAPPPLPPEAPDPQAKCEKHAKDIEAYFSKGLIRLDPGTLHGRSTKDPNLTICDMRAHIDPTMAPPGSDARVDMQIAMLRDPSMRGHFEDQFLIRDYPDGAWRLTEVPQRDMIP